MSNIIVLERENVLVVDSRLVAARLGVEHSDWLRNIVVKYQNEIEQEFESIRFENGSSFRDDGSFNPKPERYALLTEDQVLVFTTYSRNTEQVRKCKRDLVKAFSEAKKRLASSDRPLTQIQMLVAIAKQMAEQEQELLKQAEEQEKLKQISQETVKRVEAIESEQDRYNSPCGHKFTVLGFACSLGLELSLDECSNLGRQASRICKERGIETEKIRDPRFGKVGLYPESILNEVFKK